MRQKERLKALRAEVDVLTLTATPIPRTLAMSLEGLRDFSVIATAPQRRLAIKTFVAPLLASGIIREAVLRELKRGGQIYFLHNDVDIDRRRWRRRSRSSCPRRASRVAHGQMRERELEHVMRDFYQQRFNLLALHDDHRDRHRRADREHDHHQPRRPLRPRAAAPAARPRRALAPPGLRLPAARPRKAASPRRRRSGSRRSR